MVETRHSGAPPEQWSEPNDADNPLFRLTKGWNDGSKLITAIWTSDSVRGRLARGAFWSLLGSVIWQGSSLATSILTARLLGPGTFGQYGIIQSTVVMLGIFAGLGLGLTTTKYVAEFRTQDPARAARIISLGSTVAILSGGLLSLGLVAAAPMLAARTLNAPELTYELRIAGVLLFLNALNGAQTGALAGLEAFHSIARVNVVRALLAVPVTAVAVFFGRLPGAIWALSIVAAAGCVMSHVALRQHCAAPGIRARLSVIWEERRVLWRFSMPAFLSGALPVPAMWAANLMLVNQPGGYLEMGVFSAANQWRNAIGFIPGILAQSALPLLCNLNGKRDLSRYVRALRWNLILTTAAATSVAIPVALGAPWIMRLYGRDFEKGWLLLVLSAAISLVGCINVVIGNAILSAGSMWASFAFNGVWAALFVAGSYCFIPRHLALGLSGSMLGAYIIYSVWQVSYLCRRLSRTRSA